MSPLIKLGIDTLMIVIFFTDGIDSLHIDSSLDGAGGG